MTAPLKKVRCAVYTRKSSEEGLEQAFNSLDAQREAAVAYISSQKHEGWELIPTQYDDGGFSGGSMDRPALNQLLTHIDEGRIDVIVVYKVDRLSRSLHDFAQMMTLFDKKNVSFVSVTQQFNTTTSMGRLTLNILLSFAQFEREVTGERIRDKFAASRKKGLWMGGPPALGYAVKDRQLVIIEKEAELVKKIFNLYHEHHSLLKVAEILNSEGHTTKCWESGSGRKFGGKSLTPGYLNWVLRNVVYIGMARHKKEIYPGQHEPIIDKTLWESVNNSFETRERDSLTRWTYPYLLRGKMKTHEGYLMTPSGLRKKQARYYVSRKAQVKGYATCEIKNLNATELENLITAHLYHYLFNHNIQAHQFIINIIDLDEKHHWIRKVIDEVIISPDQIIIRLNKSSIASAQNNIADIQSSGTETNASHRMVWHQAEVREDAKQVILTLSIMIKRQHRLRTIMSPDGKDLTLPAQPKVDPSIVQAIGRGFKWREMLNEDSDLSISQFSRNCGFGDTFVTKQLLLTGLAPDILHQALSGTLPSAIKLFRLYDAAQFLSWERQREFLCLN